MHQTHEASSEQAFRESMLTGMAELKTKMNILVGIDGNNGWKSEVDADRSSLKEDRDKRVGANRIFTILANLGSGAIGSLLTQLLSKPHP